MARSVFGTGSDKPETGETPNRKPAVRRKPIIKGGAASDKYIRAATQGGADRTYQEIPVDQVRDSRIRDRIDLTEDLDSLAASIRENGQQIPILVRIVPEGEGTYEIVVGRRRLAALRSLGEPRIKAFVARMDDREAFIAQGIENSARLETSYIERARAAAQGLDAGHEQKDIAGFLNVSRTLISFMVKTYQALGEDLVMAIGPARGVGRRNWERLIAVMGQHGVSPSDALELVDRTIDDSVERFQALLKTVESARAKRPHPAPQAVRREHLSGSVTTLRKPKQITVRLGKSAPPDLLDRIDDAVTRLISEYDTEKE
ncbi:plasmid partitioning protein RepB [Salipiger sp. 1_MG-2023]|uniref:plasmid partitioning protein RepB n=1 Tax=Salipiger sp. 1_MG-2023 TaxID=3062665 RepID=UPI0026E2FDBA|nr:plasmid partitioning protein RepB [Salipiger sp. 1_MG-2023]MDO6588476.1 plasmid partitioning protein RepB [Salipiger sp. 1_MG-2023]